MRGGAGRVLWYRFRVTFRRRRGGYLALAILIGLLGGMAMASIVAARRTDASYPKFLASTNPSDLIVQPNGGSATTYQGGLRFNAQIGGLPHVQQLQSAFWLNAATTTPHGGIGTVLQSQVQLIASTDGLFADQDRVVITRGRGADPKRPQEVVASARAAALLGLHVGSRVPVGIWSGGQRSITPFYRRLDLTVVGIGVFNTQVVQDDIDADRTGFLLGTPALGREFASCCAAGGYIGLRLTGGSRDDMAVQREYENLENTSTFYSHGGGDLLQVLQVYNTSAIETEAQRAIRPEAIALGVFGVIAGLTALLIGAQSISRRLQAGSGDTEVLRGLGAGPSATTADGLRRDPRRRHRRVAAGGGGSRRPVAADLVRPGAPGRARGRDLPRLDGAGARGADPGPGPWRHGCGRLATAWRRTGRPPADRRPGAGRASSGRRWPPDCQHRWWQVRGSPWSRDAAGPRCRCARSSPERCWPSAWS